MMDKIILIKYGELSTKKGNIKFFIDALYKNIYRKLQDDNVIINRTMARIYIELQEDNEEIVINKLKQIFGIQGIVIAYRLKPDMDEIKNKSLEIIKAMNIKTFKVNTKRINKSFPYDTPEINNILGSYILENLSYLKVDVHNPDYILNAEIRSDYTYLYINEIKGLGGYPAGIQGKGILMLSGGIDSPVAGYLALKRGIDIECIYFESPPHTSTEALNKVIKLCQILSDYTSTIKLHVIPFTKLQEAIYKSCDRNYLITIMRRMMYRIGEKMVNLNKAYVLINGESIGQVASQTLTSMRAINSVTNIPIIRPVACLDKLEIIDISKKINTYGTSILPYEDCCTIFVPEHPVINPTEEQCLIEETKINYEELIAECISNINTIKIVKKTQFNNML